MNATIKIVRISEELLLEVLRHGTADCEAVVGLPLVSFIVAARFDQSTHCLELEIVSNDWTTADEEFIPIFRRKAE